MEPLSGPSARSSAIAALLQHGQLSRSALAQMTGLSRAAITDVTQHLLQLGLLLEEPVPPAAAAPRRGRPSTLVSLHAAHACFVGISITDVATPMVLTDLRGHILLRQPLPPCRTPAEFTAAIRTGYQRLLREAGVPRSRVRGVGITVSGIIDHAVGTCRYSAALNWRDVPIARLIGKAMQLPAWVDNDANAIAVGEKFFGRAREYRDFTTIVLGRTIGAALYLHGRLYRGHDGGAGEIGHITIDPDGALCRCGRNGCLDTIAGGLALLHTARQHGLDVHGMRDLESLAVHGNTIAIRLLRTAGKAMGSAVAALVQATNPQCVLFTDMEGFENGVFLTSTRQAIENNILPRFLASTRILFHQVEPGFLSRSAASLAAFEYLRSI